MSKREKVFCEECEYIKFKKLKMVSGDIVDDIHHPRCDCALNLKYEGNWYDRSIKIIYKRHPKIINKKNKCKWFVYINILGK